MERTEEDSYLTLAEPAEALYKEKGSKFLAYAYPVSSEEQIRECLEALRKRYYDATHHCYAWRLGADGQNYRVNDDGEPSSTAGTSDSGPAAFVRCDRCVGGCGPLFRRDKAGGCRD